MIILSQRKQPNMKKSVAYESKDKKIMPSKTLKTINHTIFSKSPSKSGLTLKRKLLFPLMRFIIILIRQRIKRQIRTIMNFSVDSMMIQK